VLKNVFLALLLVNILVLIWFTWVDTGPEFNHPMPLAESVDLSAGNDEQLKSTPLRSADRQYPEGVTPITLPAQEQPTPEPQVVVETPAKPEPAASRCSQTGTITTRAEASELLRSLESTGVQSRVEELTEREWKGHWVQVRDYPTKLAAREAADKLKQSGIKDSFVFEDGGVWVISLGVYKNKASADGLLKKAQDAGAPVIMVDRESERQAYRVQAQTGAENLKKLVYTGAEDALKVSVDINCEVFSAD